MNARNFAVAAVFAAAAASVAVPAIAGQCTDACSKAYQQCVNASATDATCLPKWGQCKKACNPQPAKVMTPAPAPTAVKVADVTAVKTTNKTSHKAKPGH